MTICHPKEWEGDGTDPSASRKGQPRWHGPRREGRSSTVMAFPAMATAVAGLLLLPVAGCSSTHGPNAGHASDVKVSPPASPSGALTTSNSEQAARLAALRAVSAYEDKLNELFLDPAKPLDGLHAVAVAPELAVEASEIGQFRAQGYRQIGRARLVSASVVDVEPRGDSTASSPAAQPTVHVTACIDVSQVDAVDSAGKSVVPSDRLPYLVERLTVVKIEQSSDASWRVSEAPNRQAKSCDG